MAVSKIGAGSSPNFSLNQSVNSKAGKTKVDPVRGDLADAVRVNRGQGPDFLPPGYSKGLKKGFVSVSPPQPVPVEIIKPDPQPLPIKGTVDTEPQPVPVELADADPVQVPIKEGSIDITPAPAPVQIVAGGGDEFLGPPLQARVEE